MPRFQNLKYKFPPGDISVYDYDRIHGDGAYNAIKHAEATKARNRMIEAAHIDGYRYVYPGMDAAISLYTKFDIAVYNHIADLLENSLADGFPTDFRVEARKLDAGEPGYEYTYKGEWINFKIRYYELDDEDE